MIRIVASGIFTMTHVNIVIGAFLGIFTGHITFALLRHNAVDKPFLRLEVITHGLRLIRCFPILENRCSLFYSCSIGYSSCIYRTAVHVHCNQGRSQFYILIVYLSISKQVRKSSFGKNNRIGCFVNNRSINRLFLGRSILCQCIHCQCIHLQRIKKQRVFLQRFIHTYPYRL